MGLKMETVLNSIALVTVVTGTFFSVVGVVGYMRLPDVYTRLHATGMVSIFGVVLLLVAAVAHTPVNWGHGLVLILVLLAAGPPTGHAIASAAHRIGLPRRHPVRDDLVGDRNTDSIDPDEC